MQHKKNRLQFESSPYLKQHETNPVDWYPWGEEALSRAQTEQKLILLSIGYSSCHWCHVMAHESFEDEPTAALMNEHYINIKVDREERPDIDEVYMEAVQLLTGHGGWPLTAILTPDLKPLFGGTYFPKTPRYGQPSFKDVLIAVQKFYVEQKSEVELRVNEILHILKSRAEMKNANQKEVDALELLPQYFLMTEQLYADADGQHGGFGGAPKFPQPSKIEALLFSNREEYKKHALFTLQKMHAGGIFDVLGGGFSRYSVDERWLVPHFEKMLYDNAQLIPIYAEAAVLDASSPIYEETVFEIFNYLEQDLKCKETRLYFSAEDADSEGEEGKFYVFSFEEFDNAIAPLGQTALLRSYFTISESGNFEGHNILTRPLESEAFADDNNVTAAFLNDTLKEATRLLKQERDQRVRPGLDDKCLLAWNALAVTGLLRAGLSLNNKMLFKRGLELLEACENSFVKDGKLLHVVTQGEAKIDAFCDDASFLLEAYAFALLTTGEKRFFDAATKMANLIKADFYDENSNIIYFSKYDAALPIRPIKPEDNVIYSPLSGLMRGCEWIIAWANAHSILENEIEVFKFLSHYAVQNIASLVHQAPMACTQSLQLIRWLEREETIRILKSGDHILSFDTLSNAYMMGIQKNMLVLNCTSGLSLNEIQTNTSKHMFGVCNVQGCQLPVDSLSKLFLEDMKI